MLSRRETKILATLGPASATPEMMRTLIREGVDGFRINMSHMRAEELDGWVRLARSAAAAEDAPVAVVVDLGGPKLRVGPADAGGKGRPDSGPGPACIPFRDPGGYPAGPAHSPR